MAEVWEWWTKVSCSMHKILINKLIKMYCNNTPAAYQICREEIDRLSNIPSEGILSCTEWLDKSHISTAVNCIWYLYFSIACMMIKREGTNVKSINNVYTVYDNINVEYKFSAMKFCDNNNIARLSYFYNIDALAFCKERISLPPWWIMLIWWKAVRWPGQVCVFRYLTGWTQFFDYQFKVEITFKPSLHVCTSMNFSNLYTTSVIKEIPLPQEAQQSLISQSGVFQWCNWRNVLSSIS